jgi:hypothetical protein
MGAFLTRQAAASVAAKLAEATAPDNDAPIIAHTLGLTTTVTHSNPSP